MKKILLSVVLNCSLTSCLFAQYGGVSVQPLVNGNTSVGFANVATNVASFSTNYTAYAWASPITVTGCVLFPFLNSTNAGTSWQYVYTNGDYEQFPGRTNFLYYDSTFGNGWQFASTRASSDGLIGVFEGTFDVSNPINEKENPDLNINFIKVSDGVTVDSTGIVSSNILFTVRTNFFIDGEGQLSRSMSPGNGVDYGNDINIIAAYDERTNLLFTVAMEGSDLQRDGKVTTWGSSYGIPWMPGMGGFQTFRYNGALVDSQLSDKRTQLIVGFCFSNNASGGGNLEFLTRQQTGTSTPNQQGQYFRAMVIDAQGGVAVGDGSYGNHGFDIIAPAWFTIVGASVATKPPFIIQAGVKYTGAVTNGALWNDSTNMHIIQRGVDGMITTTSGPKIPTAVTLSGSPFTFSNATPVALECYFSGGTAYSVGKNGASVFGSLAGDCYFILQPTNKCLITYTVAPTMFTNSW